LNVEKTAHYRSPGSFGFIVIASVCVEGVFPGCERESVVGKMADSGSARILAEKYA
jgi:hypothetical protein